MVCGMYAAASGMVAGLLGQDIVSQNLANIDTPGYRRDIAAIASFPREMAIRLQGSKDGRRVAACPIGPVGSGAFIEEVGFDRSEGPMIRTDGRLDLAIEGDGYFVISTPGGEAYTRNGSFRLNASGNLTTAGGMPVMGTTGPITIPPGAADLDVRADGTVSADGVRVGRLRVATFESPQALKKMGNGLFSAASGSEIRAESVVVRQGFLEMSNVNAVSEMVRMIAGIRTYETCQKLVWLLDQTLDKAINDVGRVA